MVRESSPCELPLDLDMEEEDAALMVNMALDSVVEDEYESHQTVKAIIGPQLSPKQKLFRLPAAGGRSDYTKQEPVKSK